MVRIGVIGCGNIMRNAHIGPTLRDHPDVELVAYYDINREAAEGFARDFGGAVAASEREVCERSDAVYIAIPPDAHGPAEQAALETGTHFFVEKPQALDLGFAREVAAEVERLDLTTCVGYQWRHSPAGRAVRDAVQASTPVLVNMFWHIGTPKLFFNRFKARSGGQVVEQATHIVDTMRYAVGEIVEVFGWQRNVVHQGWENWDNDDVGAACVRFESGALGTLTNCYALIDGAPTGSGAEILCTDRRVLWENKNVTIRRADGEERVPPFEGQPQHFEDMAFIEAVKTGDRSGILSPYSDGLKTLAVTLACATSGETGAPVAI